MLYMQPDQPVTFFPTLFGVCTRPGALKKTVICSDVICQIGIFCGCVINCTIMWVCRELGWGRSGGYGEEGWVDQAVSLESTVL